MVKRFKVREIAYNQQKGTINKTLISTPVLIDDSLKPLLYNIQITAHYEIYMLASRFYDELFEFRQPLNKWPTLNISKKCL